MEWQDISTAPKPKVGQKYRQRKNPDKICEVVGVAKTCLIIKASWIKRNFGKSLDTFNKQYIKVRDLPPTNSTGG